MHIKDRDTHLYPSTDEALGINYDMVSLGHSDGDAYLINMKGAWRFHPHWFLSLGATYVNLDAKGTLTQHLILGGIEIGVTEPIDNKISSEYWLLKASLNYRF